MAGSDRSTIQLREEVSVPNRKFPDEHARMMVGLKTREPPARRLLNRADHEFPSLMTEISDWR